MEKKFVKIPSLQEYARKKRKERVEFMDYESCHYCEFYRKENEVCLAGGNIARLKDISFCPVSKRVLNQAH